MHAAAGVVRNEKQEMLDLLRAMVQKKGSIEVEKLKMAVEKEHILHIVHIMHI